MTTDYTYDIRANNSTPSAVYANGSQIYRLQANGMDMIHKINHYSGTVDMGVKMVVNITGKELGMTVGNITIIPAKENSTGDVDVAVYTVKASWIEVDIAGKTVLKVSNRELTDYESIYKTFNVKSSSSNLNIEILDVFGNSFGITADSDFYGDLSFTPSALQLPANTRTLVGKVTNAVGVHELNFYDTRSLSTTIQEY